MFSFLSETQRLRTREFDRVIESTGLVADDQTRQGLGNLGLQLEYATSHAFLPNISHGQVSIPKSKRNSNGSGVVPRLITDGILYLDQSILSPTPRRLERMTSQLREAATPDVKGGLAQELAIANDDLRSHSHALPTGWNFPYATYINTYQGKTTFFSSRPVVTYDATISQVQGNVRTGLNMIHEFTHVVDVEEQLAEPLQPLHDSALRELRAYRVSAIAAAGCVERGVVSAHSLPACGVEALRNKHGIDSDDLLNGRLQLTAAHNDLVKQLDEGGVLSFEKRFAQEG